MNVPELYKGVRERVLQAKSRRIWQRAVKIAERFGKKDRRTGSDYTTDTYELSVQVRSIWLKIIKSSFRYGGDYILIDTTGGRVFDAKEGSEDPKDDLERIKSFYIVDRPGKKTPAPRRIQVDGYSPGVWEDLLDEQKISDALHQVTARARAVEERKLLEAQRDRPLTKEELQAIVAFGLSGK